MDRLVTRQNIKRCRELPENGVAAIVRPPEGAELQARDVVEARRALIVQLEQLRMAAVAA